ncbi:MAG: choloylglycine hydrolase family protein [Clostridia bacterium]|nr:choloylglycine hydrolase family protein [Clostridia bacterium]
MCTAVLTDSDFYGGNFNLFGRTLDLEYSLSESLIFIGRKYKLKFLYQPPISAHFAILGRGIVKSGYPLLYDAQNERGLATAALNFPDFAYYQKSGKTKCRVAAHEFILFILSRCASLKSARELLCGLSLAAADFSADLKSTPLHFMIADKSGAITVEPTRDGLKIHENPYGVLTNSPPFLFHKYNLSSYAQLGRGVPKNNIAPKLELKRYSRGMGAIGLPGDFSSASRFVRAFFVKSAADPAKSREEAIMRHFHILDSVSVPRGCVLTDENKSVFTVYSSLSDLDEFTYYFVTYGERKIRFLKPCERDISSSELAVFSDSDCTVL